MDGGEGRREGIVVVAEVGVVEGSVMDIAVGTAGTPESLVGWW